MPEKITIIGAGVSGLFLGCCLKKNNYHPTIYEKDTSLSPYGAGVNLSKNATLLLDKLGLKDELISLCLLYTSPSPRDVLRSRMPSSA